MNMVSVCNRIIRYSFYLLLFLVPLILTPWNYELFEFNKMILTYALTTIILSTWLMKMAVTKSIYLRRTPLDIPIILFLLTQYISALFSMDPHVSWFGYYSRFNGGMLSLFSYVILYYAFLSNVDHKDHNGIEPAFRSKHIATLLLITITGALLVSFYGILQRLGIDKHLWVQDVQNRVFSTLGQPNWLAAYLVALIPVSLSFGIAAQERDVRKQIINGTYLMWTIISTVFFITLLSTKSRSGLTAFALSFLIFAGILLFKTTQIKKLLISLLIPLILFAGSIFFLKTGSSALDSYITLEGLQQRFIQQSSPPPTSIQSDIVQSGTMLESGGTESGTIRKYVWEGALTAWQSSPKAFLIGTGTESFAFAFFKYKPLKHNLTSEWDFLYNKAHNEYLNYLSTTGIIGFLSYLAVLIVFILWMILLLKKPKIPMAGHDEKNEEIRVFSVSLSSVTQLSVVIGLFAGWISILITNFFGFSVVIMQLFLLLFPAIIFALIQKDSKRLHYNYSHLPKALSIGLGFTAVILGTLCLSYIGIYWIADRFYAQGYRQSRQGQLADAYRSITQAILLRPTEPNYFDELGVVLSGLSVASMEAGSATTAAQLAEQAILASDRALSISPNNVNYWKTRTKIYFGFAGADPQFVEAAINTLEKALLLSPYDPKITYNLAVLYGRLGQNDKAIELLQQTLQLKPNYRDGYYALYIFMLESKQPEQAKAILQQYLDTVDPNDKDFQSKINGETPAASP